VFKLHHAKNPATAPPSSRAPLSSRLLNAQFTSIRLLQSAHGVNPLVKQLANGKLSRYPRRMAVRFFCALLIMVSVACVSSSRTNSFESIPSHRQAQVRNETLLKSPCPICDGLLIPAHRIALEPNQPSKNVSVWNGSICGNLIFGADSPVCSQCWHAYSVTLNKWLRSSELPDTFYRPLSNRIRNVPLPPAKDTHGSIIYLQELLPGREESVSFWTVNDTGTLSKLRKYADENQLILTADQHGSMAGDVFVVLKISELAPDK
jgi:hypothetical protein